jgi:hypothetical protein
MPAENSPPSLPFVCPFCGTKSYNPHDAEHEYCGRCHVFVADRRAYLRAIEEWRERYSKKAENGT